MDFEFKALENFSDGIDELFRTLSGFPCRVDGKIEIVAWDCGNCHFIREMQARRWSELRPITGIQGPEHACPYNRHDADCQKNFVPQYSNHEEDSHGKGTFLNNLAYLLRGC